MTPQYNQTVLDIPILIHIISQKEMKVPNVNIRGLEL